MASRSKLLSDFLVSALCASYIETRHILLSWNKSCKNVCTCNSQWTIGCRDDTCEKGSFHFELHQNKRQ